MGWHRLEGTQAMVTDAPAVKATGGVDGWAASQMALRDEWQARVSALRKLERVSRNLARLRNLAQRVRLPAGLTLQGHYKAKTGGCGRFGAIGRLPDRARHKAILGRFAPMRCGLAGIAYDGRCNQPLAKLR